MSDNISHKVKELCAERGMTIKQLAEKMKIAPESLSRAINGNPQLSTIRKIAEALDVSVTDLFEIKYKVQRTTKFKRRTRR